MNNDEHLARALLSGCPSLGPQRFRRLHEAFGSAVGILASNPASWGALEGIGSVLGNTLVKELSVARQRWDLESREREKAGVKLVAPDDDLYPEGLKSLDDAPFILYMKGEWKPVDAFAVALVGARVCSVYGRAATERLARELGEAGVTVVSGLARGVDSVAHDTAVKHGKRTVGIIGSGFGSFYPEENRDLADKMAENGAVITEYPWSMGPLALNFPRRNRLISGMSQAVVVVEANLQSGALITARLAADQGRDVFAVPGSIFSPTSRGPHLLLKQGARPAEDVQDILDAMNVFQGLMTEGLIRRPAGDRKPVGPPANLPPAETALLQKISLEPAGVDALSAASGLAPGALAALLLNLELKGLIKALPGKVYVRTEAALKG